MKTHPPLAADPRRRGARVATRRTSASDNHAAFLAAMLPLGFFMAFGSSPTPANVAGALGLAILLGGFARFAYKAKHRR